MASLKRNRAVYEDPRHVSFPENEVEPAMERTHPEVSGSLRSHRPS
jgi:hypothetical protein